MYLSPGWIDAHEEHQYLSCVEVVVDTLGVSTCEMWNVEREQRSTKGTVQKCGPRGGEEEASSKETGKKFSEM